MTEKETRLNLDRGYDLMENPDNLPESARRQIGYIPYKCGGVHFIDGKKFSVTPKKKRRRKKETQNENS